MPITDNCRQWVSDILSDFSNKEAAIKYLLNDFTTSMMTRMREEDKFALAIVSEGSLLLCHSNIGEQTITPLWKVVDRMLDKDNVERFVLFQKENEVTTVTYYEHSPSEFFTRWLGIPDKEAFFYLGKKGNLEKILNHGEGNQIEFKSDIPDPSIIGKTISAFANTNGGLIFFGIDDAGKIIGIKEPKRFETEVLKAISESCPVPEYKWKTISRNNKKIGVLLLIQSNLKPVIFKNKIYKRVGASTLALSEHDFMLSNEYRENPSTMGLSNQMMKEFLTIADEDAFTEVMLVPFLRHLGFNSVIYKGHKDKTLEFGQDLKIFKYHLPTGHWLYFAAQVKAREIKSKSSDRNNNIENILTQLRMAFECEIFDNETNTQTLPDHVFLVSTGSIAEGAKQYLYQALSREKNRRILIWEGQYILERTIKDGLPLGCQIDIKRYLEVKTKANTYLY